MKRRKGSEVKVKPVSLLTSSSFILLTFNVCCILFTANCFAEEWIKTYETQYATIYYSNDSDLNNFTRDIGRGLQFFSESQGKNPMLVKNRVDGMVDRVSQILDMHPPNLHFNIYIYPAYRELESKYLSMGNFGKSPIAFYSHKTKSIYVSLADIADGVLAHEIAHVVINFFFAAPPPARMQEILAQYVDRHLWGE